MIQRIIQRILNYFIPTEPFTEQEFLRDIEETLQEVKDITIKPKTIKELHNIIISSLSENREIALCSFNVNNSIYLLSFLSLLIQEINNIYELNIDIELQKKSLLINNTKITIVAPNPNNFRGMSYDLVLFDSYELMKKNPHIEPLECIIQLEEMGVELIVT